jgi:WD40 repeat protein
MNDPVEEYTGIAIHPLGTQLAVGTTNGDVKIWDLEADKVQFSLKQHSASVVRLAFSPNGRVLVSAGDDRKIVL